MYSEQIKKILVNIYLQYGENGIIGIIRINLIKKIMFNLGYVKFHINSLYNWIKYYKKTNTVIKCKYYNYKVTPEIELFIIEHIKMNSLAKIKNIRMHIKKKFNVELSKATISTIYKKNNIKSNGKYCKVTSEIKSYIIKNIKLNPLTKIKKMITQIKETFKVTLSNATISTIYKKNNISYKRCKLNSNRYTEEEQKEQLKDVSKKIKNVDINNIISIDEMCIHLNEKPNYGWSEVGKECYYVDNNKTEYFDKRLSLLMASSNKKIIGYYLGIGSINSIIFLDFIKLINNNNHVYFIDNCKIHHSKMFKKYVTENNTNVIYNAPYQSKYNPIEYIFSMIRNKVQESDNHSVDCIKNIIKTFYDTDNIVKFNNIFNHAFNALHSSY